jgi:thiol-disulfide isomerase/thioredoxin
MSRRHVTQFLACAVAALALSPLTPSPRSAAAAPALTASADSSAAVQSAAAGPHATVETDKGPILVGEVTREEVAQFVPAWQDSAQAYRPDSSAVAILAAVAKPVQIKVVFGTWCPDSRREVPRFWKILDRAHNPNLQLEMIAVGRKSDAAAEQKLADLGLPKDFRAQYNLTAVPTLIFSQDGSELGRIIESPAGTLEGDAAGFVANVAPAAPQTGGWH